MNTVSQFGVPRQTTAGVAAVSLSIVSMEVVNGTGRAEGVDFRILQDTVEVTYHEDKRVTAFVRKELREWLRLPGLPLVGGELIFIVDQENRIALILPDVTPWPLSPLFLALLRDRV